MQNTSNFILEIRGTHQWMSESWAGLQRLVPEVGKGVGSGSGSGGSQGKLDTSSATRAGVKEPNELALLSQISKFTTYKFCFP